MSSPWEEVLGWSVEVLASPRFPTWWDAPDCAVLDSWQLKERNLMRLQSFSVAGFRSLADVVGIPISNPTILAGHNDGGKSAVLEALRFLVGAYRLVDEDRTYEPERPEVKVQFEPGRCRESVVAGTFELDAWEQTELDLPQEARIRRVANEKLETRLECWKPIPDDDRLHDLDSLKVEELRKLVKDLDLTPEGKNRPDLVASLCRYAKANSSTTGWIGLAKTAEKRMPKVLVFNNHDDPEGAIKTALRSRFEEHVADDELKGKISEIQDVVQFRLKEDAAALCQHIQNRCRDFSEISVDPDISFTEGFRGANLHISRVPGEPVSLKHSGLGSTRRISLAVWEWMSELLEHAEQAASDAEDGTEQAGPIQHIVVYDEPDTHLDYGHQRTVMSVIRDQCNLEHVNVIVATHSMNLIDGVDLSDVIHLSLGANRRTTVERLGVDEHGSINEHLRQIASAVGLRNSVLLHERCFVSVEGETEMQAFPLLFRLSEGMSMQAAGIALWGCGNNEGALWFASYLVKHQRHVRVLIDADTQSNKKIFNEHRLIQFFGAAKDDVVKLIGDEATDEFEELFDDSQWASAANAKWPRPAKWGENDFAELRSSGGKFSTKVLEMLKCDSETGPGGKPEMMYQLAQSLKDRSEVPTQLRKIFADLRQLAG